MGKTYKDQRKWKWKQQKQEDVKKRTSREIKEHGYTGRHKNKCKCDNRDCNHCT